jgi:predicted RNase H-like HicB family nuclease
MKFSERVRLPERMLDCPATIRVDSCAFVVNICGLPGKPRDVILSPMKLRLVVEHDPQTKRWAAFFPELPGCASAGDTEEEAVRNAKEALDLWFEPAPVTFPAGAKVLEVALR